MKWHVKKSVFSVLSVLVILSVSFVRCTPEKQFRTLSFFFDGVPDPSKGKDTVIVQVSDSLGSYNTKREPDSYEHKPYAEDKCESCHERGFSNRLLMPQPDLCFSCHGDFKLRYKVLHGPVASGNCTACHHQHEGKYKYMLQRKGQQICLYCHEEKQVFANKIHATVGEKYCTECHSPHGGDNRGMLKPGSCYNCHDSFKQKYAFLHGPVASGNCTACHASHSAGTPKLQLREGQQICLYCHNSDQVFKNEAHKKAKKMNCTECHNPHGGSDHFIFAKSFTPIKKVKTPKPAGNGVAGDSTNQILTPPANLQESPGEPADTTQGKSDSPQRKYKLR